MPYGKSLSVTLKINMFEARGHLLDTPNLSLSVIVKNWLERKKSFTKKQKEKRKRNLE